LFVGSVLKADKKADTLEMLAQVPLKQAPRCLGG